MGKQQRPRAMSRMGKQPKAMGHEFFFICHEPWTIVHGSRFMESRVLFIRNHTSVASAIGLTFSEHSRIFTCPSQPSCFAEIKAGQGQVPKVMGLGAILAPRARRYPPSPKC